MIIEPRFLVPFPAGVPISLHADLDGCPASLECAAAKRRVFLVRDQCGGSVDLETTGKQVATDLIAHASACGRVRFYEGDALAVVHHVQRVTLERHRGTVGPIFAIDFRVEEINAFALARTVLPQREFAHTYAAGAVDEERGLRRPYVYDLARRGDQHVFEVPNHDREVLHLRD